MENERHIPGISEPLPEGERLLWSGAPAIAVQLRRGSLLPIAGGWLVLSAALPLVMGSGGTGPTPAHLAWVGVVGLFIVACAVVLAWLVTRTTVYAVTDRRVVMHIGIALPAVLNIPLDTLAGATTRTHPDGSGDINLPLAEADEHPGYALLWPHARPWRLARPEPALRWLDDIEAPARALREVALAHSERFTVESAPAHVEADRSSRRAPQASTRLAGERARG